MTKLGRPLPGGGKFRYDPAVVGKFDELERGVLTHLPCLRASILLVVAVVLVGVVPLGVAARAGETIMFIAALTPMSEIAGDPQPLVRRLTDGKFRAWGLEGAVAISEQHQNLVLAPAIHRQI